MEELKSFGFLLSDTTRLYRKRFEERSRALGFTLTQCKILVNLVRNEGISQSRLCELIEMEPMNLVRSLDHMEVDGWVERRADPADRRARRLFLKPKAEAVIAQIWTLSAVVRNEAFTGIPRAQAKMLMTLLENLRDNILGLQPLPSVAASRAAESAEFTAGRARRPRAMAKS